MWIGSSLYWKFQVVGWGVFGLINILLAFFFEKLGDAESTKLILTRLGIFLLVGIVLTHIMRAVILRLHTLQRGAEIQLAQLFFISVIFSLITATLYMRACEHLGLLNDGEKRFMDNPLLLVLSSTFYFFINIVIWNLIYFSYNYVTQSRKQQLDALKIESLIKELELEAMAS
ncbi:MAG: hypothetical protein E6Q24_20480 [Chitinophagaceae bacterium]|nr:MAG: hypothetical protein E6Q24_20480 [Chitinophagaceae bacterium]